MQTRLIQTGGLNQQILEAGSGPLVLLIHGFPELGISWRAQVEALADAGYHAVAPDMRGYGGTDKPVGREDYSILHLVGDMVDLVRALGETQCIVAGHDWGAPVAWHCALTRPDLFRAVFGLSVPFQPRRPKGPPTALPIAYVHVARCERTVERIRSSRMPASTASPPKTSPAKSSNSEKFCHMRLAVCQWAMSVSSASVKQTTGNWTRMEWRGRPTMTTPEARAGG